MWHSTVVLIFYCVQGLVQSYLKIPLDQVPTVDSPGVQDERDNKSKNTRFK